MREMTQEEIRTVIENQPWATICTVSPDGEPYAIEATPFLLEADLIGFMINPRGTTKKNLDNNPKILIKYSYSKEDLQDWAGVSCFGCGEFSEDKDLLQKGWDLLEKIMQTDYSKVSQKFIDNKIPTPLLTIRISRMSGRCSAAPKEPMLLPWTKHA